MEYIIYIIASSIIGIVLASLTNNKRNDKTHTRNFKHQNTQKSQAATELKNWAYSNTRPSPTSYLNQQQILPYCKTKLLTHYERSFFEQLKIIAVNKNLYLFAKVRLADIVNVKNGTDDFYKYFNQIKSKHIDFVLSDNEMNVLCCIELDDSSHDNKKAQENDQVKNDALAAAGVPIIRTRTFIGLEQVINETISK